jgi:uncharacterized membrane protein HdeD (DUF308 family)
MRPVETSSSWGWPFVFGLITAAVGVLAIIYSVAASLFSVLFLGWTLVFIGIILAVSAFTKKLHTSQFWIFLLDGVIAVVVGILLLRWPLAGLGVITLLIAAYMLVSGLFHGITSVVDRYPHWGWNCAYGVLTFLVGIYLYATWPISALWLLGLWVGVSLFFRGLMTMGWALQVRKLLPAARA